MDTALPQKFPFILDRNLAKANCTENHVCTSCDTVVLDTGIFCICTSTRNPTKCSYAHVIGIYSNFLIVIRISTSTTGHVVITYIYF